MVFVDSLDEGTILAIYLRNLLLEHMQSDEKRLIRTFNLILEPDTKTEYLEDFHNNDTKI